MTIELNSRLSSMKITLYRDGLFTPFNISLIEEYLSSKIGIDVRFQASLWKGIMDGLFEELAGARVTDPSSPVKNRPMQKEIEIERKQIESGKIIGGMVYDAPELQRILLKALPESEKVIENLHLIFTDRLLATYVRPEMMYHLRTLVCGYPSLISLPGLIEAPARSRVVQLSRRYGKVPEVSTEDHLDYHDPRITDVAKGFAVQVLSYYLFDQPFCEDPLCRLYNAHRQSEMLKAQLSKPEYCENHRVLLQSER